MTKLSIVVLLCLSSAASPFARTQRLTIRVSPVVALAPAVLTVHTTIEPSDDIRALTIVVDSASYHRSSEIPLDGIRSRRVTVFELKDLPSGLYEVRAVLLGTSGPVARGMQLVKVEPAAGYTR
jgi:hypothetical protein